MRRAAAVVALAGALLGCAEPGPSRVAYNRGVDAYRAGDYATARVEWERSVEEGDPTAMNNLGYLLAGGYGGDADPARAVALWRRAAAVDHSEAKLHLGAAYQYGRGVEKDEAQAFAWYLCAVRTAEMGRGLDAAAEDAVANDASRRLVGLLDDLSPAQVERGRALAYDCRPRP